jgi:predicted CXXCH cytochrome family protein
LPHPQSLSYKSAVFSRENFQALRALLVRHRCRVGWTLFGVSILGPAALLISCSSIERQMAPPPEIPGATFTGNASCVDCHATYTRVFAASPHARLDAGGTSSASPHSPAGPRGARPSLDAGTGCESCHGPGSKHIAAGGGRGKFIVNPGRDPQACFSCHLETHAEFNLPQHHPVPEGKMNCVQCHDPHGFDIMKPAGGLAMARQNEQCASCHRNQSRRFVFEHEALREGCTTCHAPHGSVNRKMLTQADPNLCLRCHAQTTSGRGEIIIGAVPHTTYLKRGTCWTSTCHTAVHGSNVDPHLRY